MVVGSILGHYDKVTGVFYAKRSGRSDRISLWLSSADREVAKEVESQWLAMIAEVNNGEHSFAPPTFSVHKKERSDRGDRGERPERGDRERQERPEGGRAYDRSEGGRGYDRGDRGDRYSSNNGNESGRGGRGGSFSTGRGGGRGGFGRSEAPREWTRQ